MSETLLLINNEDIPASGGRVFERVGPVSSKVETYAAASSVDDARHAADAAGQAARAWAAVGPTARRAMLLKAAGTLEARQSDFVAAMAAELGATAGWACFNVTLAANMLREAAAMTTQIGGEVIPSDKPGCIAMAVRVPAGVVLGIAPWNAPVILGVRSIALPLACGNTVIMKASEMCPRTHWLIGDVFREAGLPPGVVNVITNAPADAAEVVESLISHPVVRRINFTGSTKVGRIIAQLAARHLKPVLLELGGKAPLVVLDDADLDEAVKSAAFGAFMNQGQICMSTERIIVSDSIAEVFVDKLGKKAATLLAGDPTEGKAPLGSLISQDSLQHINELIEDALDKGATLVAGGVSGSLLMNATVLDSVTPAMRIYREESFGPVVSVVRVKDDEEAVCAANDTEYGLSSAVFSRNIVRALDLAQRIQAGMCHINGSTVHDEAQMPFGGMKDSGYGRFGGKAGIEEFTDLRWITIERQPGQYPI